LGGKKKRQNLQISVGHHGGAAEKKGHVRSTKIYHLKGQKKSMDSKIKKPVPARRMRQIAEEKQRRFLRDKKSSNEADKKNVDKSYTPPKTEKGRGAKKFNKKKQLIRPPRLEKRGGKSGHNKSRTPNTTWEKSRRETSKKTD